MTPGFISEDMARLDPLNGGAEYTNFTHSRHPSETIITYLERLCDEFNAPEAQK